MSSTDAENIEPEERPVEKEVQTRVDAAHLAVSAPEAAESQPSQFSDSQKLARVANIAAGWLGDSSNEPEPGELLRLLPPEDFQADQVEQLRGHAVQLAEHLQARQAELDHREAQLNARAASVESQARTTRLWLEEQRKALAVRREMIAEADQAEQTHQDSGAAANSGEQWVFENLAVEELVSSDGVERPDSNETMCEGTNESGAEALDEGAIGSDDECSADAQVEQRQRELDKRQAQLYQDIEDLTIKRAETRGQQEELDAIRKELETTRGELIKRRQELEQQSSEYGEKSEQLENLRHEIDASVSEQEIQCEEIEQRERQLDSRLREIETALRRFERLGITEQRMRSLEQEVAEADARGRYLDQAEDLLSQQQNDSTDEKRDREQERLAFEEERQRWRQKTTEMRSRYESQKNSHRAALDRRAVELDSREASLEHVRLELAASQREVLELRLATEEVWAQLSGALAPATLSRSIAQTRARLADQYRQEASDLAGRKQLLESTSQRLAEQTQKMSEQREELHRWAQRRQEEIEEQAQRLVRREQELDRQQATFEDLLAHWEQERIGYQEQIRELLIVARQREGKMAA